MNELVEKTNGGRNPGGEPPASVAGSVPQEPSGKPPVGNAATQPLPSVPIGKPGYTFKHAVNTPQGQEERREHNRLWKQSRRATKATAEVAALPSAAVVDAPQAPTGQQEPGVAPAPGAVVAEPFIPWIADDVKDFTDELVELAEAKRVTDFVAIAKEANMPARFIAEVEKKSSYPTHSKSALKRCLAECAAKWLNKTGVSSKNKEEVKLLFVMVTIKMQGVRLKRDLVAMCDEEKASRLKETTEKKTDKPASGEDPLISIVK